MSQPLPSGGDDGRSSPAATTATPSLLATPPPPLGDASSQQQQQSMPLLPSASSSADRVWADILQDNCLGVHVLDVKQVSTTEYTRQISAKGLIRVKESIVSKGWNSTMTPYVLVPREQLPDGHSTIFTLVVLSKLSVYCLDGNHRIQALRDLKGPEFRVGCRLYLHFDDSETINALARSANGVTEATAEVTTYDRIFSTKKAIEAIMAKKGFTDPNKVTGSNLAEAYRKGGDKPPSPQQLCCNKRLAIGFSDEAFAALKAVSESSDQNIDEKSLSKNLLDSPIVLTDLKAHPLEQTFMINILARYKKFSMKAPHKTDLPNLKGRVMEAGILYRRVENVLPRSSWTHEFEKSLLDLIHGKQTEWDTWGGGHVKGRDKELQDLQDLLPSGNKLQKDQQRTVLSKLPVRLEKIARKNADLRGAVDAWDQAMAGVNLFVDQHKDLEDVDSSPSDDDDEDDEDDEEDEEDGKDEEDEGADKTPTVLCTQCKPKEATGFCCPSCGMHHRAKCAHVAESDDDASAERTCLECPTVEPQSKKRKKNPTTTLPKDPNADVDDSMSRNTIIHPGELFVGRAKTYHGGTPLAVNRPPMLALVDLTKETHLLKDVASSRTAAKVVLQSIVSALDPKGTLALAMPRPWMFGAGLNMAVALNDIEDVIVEEHPFLVVYETVAGGSQRKGQENHLRNVSELIVLVHRDSGSPFTCNKRVVTSDVFGHSHGPCPHAKSVLTLNALPAGAPNGGSRCFFPEKAVHFLVGRYTNLGDTVLGVGVETTVAAEQSIDKGRRVEFYVSDDKNRAMLATKIQEAFRKAHGRGLFQSRFGDEAVVGPTVLPVGLAPSCVPPRVEDLVKERLKVDGNDRLSACFSVAQTIAKDYSFELKLQPDGDKNQAELHHKKKRASRAPASFATESEILVWGDLIVYTTPAEARASLQPDEIDEQFVRVVQVADNGQLRIMLEGGVEHCGPEAALYIRVDPTCPIYWVRWDENKSKADLDIVCDIPRRGSRAAVLKKVPFAPDGSGGVRIHFARNKPSPVSPGRRGALLVNADSGRIVGSEKFTLRASAADGGEPTGEEEEDA